MKNKSVSILIGMVTKKFYCHKCGERLSKHPKTRTVKPGDPDYRKHNRINHRTHMIGDVEVTEYDFQCPACGNVIEYDEQCVIGKIKSSFVKIYYPMKKFSTIEEKQKIQWIETLKFSK